MQFSQPYALWFIVLAILPFLSTVIFSKYYRIYLSETFQKRRSKKWEWIRTTVASLVIAGLVVILANPIRVESVRNPLKNGIDILFVLDLSKSMLAEDIAPNRINAGKRVLSNFIGERSSDRIGLIGFAGKPFVFSPLTFDHAGLLKIVSDMTVDSIKQEIPGFSGTAIGDGLLLASDAIKTEPDRKKVIILLTDGEANVGIDPNVVNEYMKMTGVVIHTIGIGDPEGTDLYTTDQFGKKQYFMDNRGVPIRASIDEPLLRKLAGDNGGIYANAASLKEMEKALENLNQLYGKTLETPMETIVIPYAPYVAYFVLLLVSAWLAMEAFSITGAYHISRLSGIALTEESVNYVRIPSLLWGKRVLLLLGFLSLTLGAVQYRYQPPIGTISILIDGSKSMQVEDVGQSRFTLAKQIAGKIIDGYSGNPIRISVF
jgi:Ca-activated chloride channel family protein